MIVVDTSVFIDLFFEYDRKRTQLADALFKIIEEKGLPIFELRQQVLVNIKGQSLFLMIT
ncbi:hypothetical protein PFDSM3638_03865 [Pyrococcus furiosus DSM 3638]|uniref:PIN domain-containing protein n=3 Tax=Pyrococcus furiosus TaxID=2261 RepID=A0A5C0XMW8_PYRFU|nr:hypothetical protein [Pyrococcus furiosus]AAL80902.1 hypothetical protein PF0778 [Pyrococcus furiosus DSM 3638]AFN03561.1 hypothetical protein PFC_03040 [Pyrococcus furiosus COM1]QEK78456.1 hypothetical protein PFDSM3638_03865 [Pyrococcus furiosus DSM 3638]